jgi:hypothetical protein
LALLNIEMDLFSFQSVIVVVYRMSRAAYCYLLILCFPLCLDDEELSYTSDSVGSEACGMIAVLDCERWTEYQVVRRRCHLNLTLIKVDRVTPRATRSLIDRKISSPRPTGPDRIYFRSHSYTSDQLPTMTIASSGTT